MNPHLPQNTGFSPNTIFSTVVSLSCIHNTMTTATEIDADEFEHDVSDNENSNDEPKKEFRPLNILADILLRLNAAIKELASHVGSSNRIDPSLLTIVEGMKFRAQSVEEANHTIFHPFPILPPELRLRIWKVAAMATHIIEVQDVPQNNTEDKERLLMWLDGVNINGHRQKIRSLSGKGARCSLLLTCKEARQETRKTRKNYNAFDPLAPKIYINLEIDTLWVSGCRPPRQTRDGTNVWPAWEALLKGSTQEIRSLAIDQKPWHVHRGYEKEQESLDACWTFEQLRAEEVLLAVKQEELADDNRAFMVMPRKDIQTIFYHENYFVDPFCSEIPREPYSWTFSGRKGN
ncbi:hypothetical protein B0J14DRAFT_670535 [Halenospora varia]|nr:hypothetical protein B0J14DRAFT_670535 [Halenospora varia]